MSRHDDVPSPHRAAAAAWSVQVLFGRRLFGIPGTYLPHVSDPSHGRGQPWHYWWLAHYLECLLDESQRERRRGAATAAARAERQAHRLLVGIGIRNGLTYRNFFYDDMAWLALATQRLRRTVDHRAHRAHRRLVEAAARRLSAGLEAGEDNEAGGVFWNGQRDTKNIASTGPAAIFHARAGNTERARALVDWIYATLYDAQSGLLLDRVHREPDGRWALVRDVYTYNQGATLGALVELGDPTSLVRAAALVEAIDTSLVTAGRHRALRTHGGHDGGLFTGIAVRYLAQAARSPALPDESRRRCAAMARGTADALWAGRDERPAPRAGLRWLRFPDSGMPDRPAVVFSPDPARPASVTQPPGTTVELSTQLQAWTTLEAADALGWSENG